jgi:hypothetical protein
MKLIRNLSLALSLMLITSFSGDSSVFVCDSNTSVAYHYTKTCRGLNACTHTIIQVSKTSAINSYGKRACKICY